jgi:cystathionine beta-lyase/cystathionine gamma-synthase
MTLNEAIDKQFEIVQKIYENMTAKEFLSAGDFGQAAHPDGRPMGFGGGRPERTIEVEKVMASLFNTEAALLVLGGGTGAVRTALSSVLPPGGMLLIHDAPIYKTTEATIKSMGYLTIKIDFNNLEALDNLKEKPDAALIQHIPQKPGDNYRLSNIISALKKHWGDDFPVIVDDNYAVMRARKIGVELKADLSAFSFFKLLGPEGIGCIVGKRSFIEKASTMLSSAGCQVQGPTAMAALRGLVYSPVALALQKQVIEQVANEISEMVKKGEKPWVDFIDQVVPLEVSHPNVLVLLKKPIASQLLKASWEIGAAAYSVGEESIYDIIPVFTYVSSNFIKAWPELKEYAIRINPFRSGPETVIDIFRKAIQKISLF